MKYGYVCISNIEQDINKQINEIREYGVDEVYQDHICIKSSKRPGLNRPELQKLIKALRTGDTLVVYRLDRLGRNIRQFLHLLEAFKKKDVNLVSLHEQLDATTDLGRHRFSAIFAIAQMERYVIAEREGSRFELSRDRGVYGGRRPVDTEIVNESILMYSTNEFTVKEIMEKTGIKRSTLYKYIRSKEDSK